MRLLFASLFFLALFAAPVSAVPVVVNADFETDANLFVSFPGYTGGSNPAEITGWPGSGLRGINPGSGAGQPFAPVTSNGTNFAFLQLTGATISQSISGFDLLQSYRLDYDNAMRNGNSGGVLTASIAAGVNVTNPTSAQFTSESLVFVATATTLTLTFTNTSGAGDITVDIDNITFTPVPEPTSVALLGFGAIGLIAARRRKG